MRYYIHGETASISQRRKKFSAWGGLASLYYLNKTSVLSEVRTFFDNSSMKDIQVTDLTLLRDTLKKLSIENNKNKINDLKENLKTNMNENLIGIEKDTTQNNDKEIPNETESETTKGELKEDNKYLNDTLNKGVVMIETTKNEVSVSENVFPE